MYTRPELQRLEDRTTPATVRALFGNLLITNPVGPLSVEVVAPATVRVSDSATSATFGGIASLISIQGTNNADSVTFRAEAAAFPGTLVIATFNGNDVVDLGGNFGRNTIGLPNVVNRFGGDTTIITGLGNDAVVSTGGAVRVGGNFTVADVQGANTWNLNGRAWTVGRDLTFYGLTSLVMGATGSLGVGGFASLTAIQPVASTMTLNFNGVAFAVGRTLSITGGSVANFVQITSRLTVGGIFFLTQRGGANNTFNLVPAAGGSGVNGNLFYTGGVGLDNVLFGINAAIAGDTTIDMSQGTNVFADAVNTSYAGSLRFFGGNETTTISVNGSIDGGLTLFAGNGTNNVTVTTVPAGRLTFRGGNGSDMLRLRGAGTYTLDANFGTGTNLFDVNRVGLVLNGNVMGGGGDNTFVQGAATLLPTLFLINFPV